MTDKLEKKLHHINEVTRKHCLEQKHIGVFSGLSGTLLFQFYYSKFIDPKANTDIAEQVLHTIIERINQGYKIANFSSGIAGFSWTIDHLESQGFVEIGADEFLPSFEDYLAGIMTQQMANGKYDFLHAANGYAFYFLCRHEHTQSDTLRNKYRKYLRDYLHHLEESAIPVDQDKIMWTSKIDLISKEEGINVSLAHGMSSTMVLLAKLSVLPSFRLKTLPLLEKTINYILSFKKAEENPFSFFPNWVTQEGGKHENSRLAWCYGDLGIGTALWQAGKILDRDHLKTTALHTLEHAASRTAPDDSKVKDAGLCHGSFGNSLLFSRLHQETGRDSFAQAADFWFQDGFDKAIHDDGYGGFKKWNWREQAWDADLSFLEGVAGIGLVIMNHLSTENLRWDDCLLIR